MTSVSILALWYCTHPSGVKISVSADKQPYDHALTDKSVKPTDSIAIDRWWCVRVPLNASRRPPGFSTRKASASQSLCHSRCCAPFPMLSHERPINTRRISRTADRTPPRLHSRQAFLPCAGHNRPAGCVAAVGAFQPYGCYLLAAFALSFPCSGSPTKDTVSLLSHTLPYNDDRAVRTALSGSARKSFSQTSRTSMPSTFSAFILTAYFSQVRF